MYIFYSQHQCIYFAHSTSVYILLTAPVYIFCTQRQCIYFAHTVSVYIFILILIPESHFWLNNIKQVSVLHGDAVCFSATKVAFWILFEWNSIFECHIDEFVSVSLNLSDCLRCRQAAIWFCMLLMRPSYFINIKFLPVAAANLPFLIMIYSPDKHNCHYISVMLLFVANIKLSLSQYCLYVAV